MPVKIDVSVLRKRARSDKDKEDTQDWMTKDMGGWLHQFCFRCHSTYRQGGLSEINDRHITMKECCGLHVVVLSARCPFPRLFLGHPLCILHWDTSSGASSSLAPPETADVWESGRWKPENRPRRDGGNMEGDHQQL